MPDHDIPGVCAGRVSRVQPRIEGVSTHVAGFAGIPGARQLGGMIVCGNSNS